MFLLIPFLVVSQKWSTKSGAIHFEASVPSFEEVKASNDNVSALLKSDTGEFAALALMNGFRFKVALMEEHFNENYAESSKYPKATFKGSIKNFKESDLTNQYQKFEMKGEMTIHGQTKPFETLAYIKKQDGHIEMKSEFNMNPEDYNIDIPKIVRNKIADEVNVSILFKLSQNQ